MRATFLDLSKHNFDLLEKWQIMYRRCTHVEAY